MSNLPQELTCNGIHYALHGDYYYPDMGVPETSLHPLGHYGRMRTAYLKEHRPGLYERLILSGMLYEHLAEIDNLCRNRVERLIREMAQAEGVDEKLKAKNQFMWVGWMNNIRQRAEEAVLSELIYD